MYPLRAPLPNPVLRTDYRLRSIAAGDRASCSLQGKGEEGRGWGSREALFFRLLASRSATRLLRRFLLAARQWRLSLRRGASADDGQFRAIPSVLA